jgi:hypothetical protein
MFFTVVKVSPNLGTYLSVCACKRAFRDAGFISVNTVQEADIMFLQEV